MGSICSTRQSTKDNTSEHSDEYKPNEEKNQKSGAPEERTTSSDTSKQKDKQVQNEDPRSNGGTTGGPPPPPATTAVSSDLSRGKSLEEKQTSISEDLPDLTGLQDATRSLIEGKIDAPNIDASSGGVCICLIGDSLDSGSERKKLESHLTKTFSSKFDSQCKDFWAVNIDTDLLETYSLDRGHLITDYIKDISSRNLVLNLVFLNDTVGQVLPPPLILKSDFDSLINSLEKKEDKDVIKKWYKEDLLASRPFVKLNWTMSIPRKEYAVDFEKIAKLLIASADEKLKEHYLKTPLEQTIDGLIDKKENFTNIWVRRHSDNDKKKLPSNSLDATLDKERTQKLTKLVNESIPQERALSLEQSSQDTSFNNITSEI